MPLTIDKRNPGGFPEVEGGTYTYRRTYNWTGAHPFGILILYGARAATPESLSLDGGAETVVITGSTTVVGIVTVGIYEWSMPTGTTSAELKITWGLTDPGDISYIFAYGADGPAGSVTRQPQLETHSNSVILTDSYTVKEGEQILMGGLGGAIAYVSRTPSAQLTNYSGYPRTSLTGISGTQRNGLCHEWLYYDYGTARQLGYYSTNTTAPVCMWCVILNGPPVDVNLAATATLTPKPTLVQAPVGADRPRIYTFSNRWDGTPDNLEQAASVIDPDRLLLLAISNIYRTRELNDMSTLHGQYAGVIKGGTTERYGNTKIPPPDQVEITADIMEYATEVYRPSNIALTEPTTVPAGVSTADYGWWIAGSTWEKTLVEIPSKIMQKVDFATETAKLGSAGVAEAGGRGLAVQSEYVAYVSRVVTLNDQLARFYMDTETWALAGSTMATDVTAAASPPGGYGYFYEADDTGLVGQYQISSETWSSLWVRPNPTYNDDAVGWNGEYTYELSEWSLNDGLIQTVTGIILATLASLTHAMTMDNRIGVRLLSHIPGVEPPPLAGIATITANPAEYLLGTWTGQVRMVATAAVTAALPPRATLRATAALRPFAFARFVGPKMAYVITPRDTFYLTGGTDVYSRYNDAWRPMTRGYSVTHVEDNQNTALDVDREQGFIAGGMPSRTAAMSVLEYPIEQHSYISETLNTAKSEGNAAYTADNGYWFGGYDGGLSTPILEIERFDFATQTNVVVANTLTVGRLFAVSLVSLTDGYSAYGSENAPGSNSYGSYLDKFVMATEVYTHQIQSIPPGYTSSSASGCSTPNYGMISIGSAVQDLTFSTDTAAETEASYYSGASDGYSFALESTGYVANGGFLLEREANTNSKKYGQSLLDYTVGADNYATLEWQRNEGVGAEANAFIYVSSDVDGHTALFATAELDAVVNMTYGGRVVANAVASLTPFATVVSVLVDGATAMLAYANIQVVGTRVAQAKTVATAIASVYPKGAIVKSGAVAMAAVASVLAKGRSILSGPTTVAAVAQVSAAGLAIRLVATEVRGYALSAPTAMVDRITSVAMRGYAVVSASATPVRTAATLAGASAFFTALGRVFSTGEAAALATATANTTALVARGATTNIAAVAALSAVPEVTRVAEVEALARAGVSSHGVVTVVAQVEAYCTAEVDTSTRLDQSFEVRSQVSGVVVARGITEVVVAERISSVQPE